MRLHGRLLRVAVLSALGFASFARAQEASPPAPGPGFIQPAIVDGAVRSETNCQRILPWGGIQYITGPGPGYRDGYSSLEGFIPVYQDNVGIFFGSLRGVLANDNMLSANLGGGYRYYSSDYDRIWGGNLFYDRRDTGQHDFNQVGFGFESLGRFWDARTNVYLVTGQDQRETFSFFSNPAFVQHFILLDRIGVGQAAMSGFDAEVGAPLTCAWGLKVYVGTYNYQVANSPQAWGFKARLEERVDDNLELNLTYANDRVFGNSVIFEAGYRFGGRRTREGAARCDTFARRADRVVRNQQIVVTEQVVTTHQLALDPGTGQPIVVQHVASYAASGGDGTFEHPLQRLAQLQAGSAPGNLLFAWANSVFDNQSITLQNGQRFLGEGWAHQFVAKQGTFLLPRATTFTAAPAITNPQANAITLANNNEVSGFSITNGAMNGIYGNGVTGFNINRNTITGFTLGGVFLENINGQGAITGNIANGNGSDPSFGGIIVAGTNFAGTIAGNTANDNLGSGIALRVENANATIQGNSANNTQGILGSGSGIVVSATNFIGSITGNMANANHSNLQGFGIRVITTNSFIGTIANNTTNNNDGEGGGGVGIQLLTTSFNGSINGNTAIANVQAPALGGGNGIVFQIFDAGGTITGNLTGNVLIGNGGEGVRIENSLAGMFNIHVLNNIFQGNNGGVGREFLAQNSSAGQMCMLLDGNTSANIVPPGQFNYDLQNLGTGTFILQLGANQGSVGSSAAPGTFPMLGICP